MLDHQFIEALMQCLSGGFEVSHKLSHQQACDGTVLIASIGSDEIPMGFLGTKNKSVRPASVDQACDPFETDMDITFASNPIGFGHPTGHFGSHQGLDHIGILGQIAHCFAL